MFTARPVRPKPNVFLLNFPGRQFITGTGSDYSVVSDTAHAGNHPNFGHLFPIILFCSKLGTSALTCLLSASNFPRQDLQDLENNPLKTLQSHI